VRIVHNGENSVVLRIMWVYMGIMACLRSGMSGNIRNKLGITVRNTPINQEVRRDSPNDV